MSRSVPRRRGVTRRAGCRITLGLGFLLLASTRAAGQGIQTFVPDTLPVPPGAAYWVGEASDMAVNAVIGGAAAGLLELLRGGSFRDGFTRGALGGAVIYGGKRIAAQRFDGAGLIGREVSATGASMVRNAGEGRGLLQRVMLPVGPVMLYVDPWAPRRLRVHLDAVAAGWILYAVGRPELHFDLGRSLSAGVPVFLTHNELIKSGRDEASGLAEPGTVLLADVPIWGPVYATRTGAHERVHVLQHDAIFLTVIDPVLDRVLPHLPGGGWLDRRVDINLSEQLLQVLGPLFGGHDARPWEVEADYLAKHP